jgi:hypothetical protein
MPAAVPDRGMFRMRPSTVSGIVKQRVVTFFTFPRALPSRQLLRLSPATPLQLGLEGWLEPLIRPWHIFRAYQIPDGVFSKRNSWNDRMAIVAFLAGIAGEVLYSRRLPQVV